MVCSQQSCRSSCSSRRFLREKHSSTFFSTKPYHFGELLDYCLCKWSFKKQVSRKIIWCGDKAAGDQLNHARKHIKETQNGSFTFKRLQLNRCVGSENCIATKSAQAIDTSYLVQQ